MEYSSCPSVSTLAHAISILQAAYPPTSRRMGRFNANRPPPGGENIAVNFSFQRRSIRSSIRRTFSNLLLFFLFRLLIKL